MSDSHDPLDVLRVGYAPVAPDAAFAARLRARLELAVLNPMGAPMTSNDATTATPVTQQSAEPREGDLVYSSLWLPDVARGAAFYGAVLGWRIQPGHQPKNRVVANVTPPAGMSGEQDHGTLFLCHAVDDIEAALARVRAAGGTAGDANRSPYGLIADCTDNQGMRFALLNAPRADRRPKADSGPGELLYLTIETRDSALYREFYGSVFGWTFAPGRVDDGWRINGVSPMGGMHGGQERSTVVPMYGVPDVAAAVAAVRAAGGTATEPERMPYGTTSDCTDDQGVRFYLGQV
ncbi:MAG TPA: VOC family protein [Pseudonocardiaceae bacterium]|jgi:predicted enzyme related to lactoylglutathione lyase|nr:VOC family protein [Pseudonocardiaceae bacterium]